MTIADNKTTICALCTPPGLGSVSIVRISGVNALTISEKIFSKKLKKPRYFYYGQFLNGKTMIDEGLCVFFNKPHSFTGEDVIEYHLHGGKQVSTEILKILENKGAVIASPGEFSYRAYMNGKIDLLKAEAISDIINSDSQASLSNSIMNYSGNFNKKFNNIKDLSIELLAEIESRVDFPEEDIPLIENKKIYNLFDKIELKLKSIIQSYDKGVVLKNGLRVLILGPPNAGKSTMFNSFLENEKAIVSNEPGTTRDTLEYSILYNGLKLIFLDTAGIRSTTNKIEKIGIDKALKEVEFADLVLLINDISIKDNKIIENNIKSILKKLKKVPRGTIILVNNKIDLIDEKNLKEKLDFLKSFASNEKVQSINISALDSNNSNEVMNKIVSGFSNIAESNPESVMTNERQKNLTSNALEALYKAKELYTRKVPLEIVSIDIRSLLNIMSEITGEISNNDIYDVIFAKFCIGK